MVIHITTYCITPQMICIATLITAALTLAALSNVEEYADSNGGRLHVNPNIRKLDGSKGDVFEAEGSRGAAGYLIFVCCAGIVFHLVSIFVRVYYIYSDTTKQTNLYFILVSKMHLHTYNMCICEVTVAIYLKVSL